MSFNISLQLYTVRDALQTDFLGGIKRVSELGYPFVEFAGFGGHSAAEVARTLKGAGMKASGAHVPLSVFEDASPIIDELLAIGCNQATIPSIPEEMRSSKEKWIESAKKIENAVPVFAEAGIGLGYHNHAFEWDEFEGYATLVENAPSANLQLDVFWAKVAGQDPIEWINRLSGRLPSIHCKDFGADGVDIELGDGVLDFVEILRAAKDAGTQTLVVEMDTPRLPPMESAAKSLKGLRAALDGLDN
jgi:sugar phosphate isomerase/epimerase